MAGDGQVTLDKTVMKSTARKVRRLAEGQVLAGFAGATADAFQLFELFEKKLKEHARSLPAGRGRAGQAVAHRPLPAPAGGAAGGGRPRQHLRALRGGRRHRARRRCRGAVAAQSGRAGPTPWPRRGRCWPTPRCPARAVAEEAMKLAAEICIYTNDQLTIEEL